MKHSDQTDKIIGQSIGPKETSPYRLISLLGRQTGRRTFLAIDTRTQQKVVIKLLLFGPDFTWDDLKLFEREAETLKALDHPAIPQYLDSFEVETLLGEGFALVQTYIEAKSLQEWVTSGYRFGEQELKIIAGALLTILQYLHSRHPAVVHRDIKPSNVLLSEQMGHAPGRVYLVDFGSVQATTQGATMTVVGTYGYMPPEQFGGRAQPASDLYSLGATLIYLSSGQHPAELPQENMQIDFENRARFSPSFAGWVRQLTYADLAQRTPSATEAARQLNAVVPPEAAPSLKPDSLVSSLLKPDLKYSDVVKARREEISAQGDRALSAQSDRTLALPQKCNDFIIASDERTFEITFLRDRIQQHSNKKQATKYRSVYLSLMVALILLLIVLAAAISVNSIVLLGVFPTLLFFPNRKEKAQNHRKLSSLKIGLDEQGSMMLSVNRLNSAASFMKPDPGLTYLPLRSISVDAIASWQNRSINFHFIHNDGRGRGEIRLQASRSETQWLCDHLLQWKDIPIQWNR